MLPTFFISIIMTKWILKNYNYDYRFNRNINPIQNYKCSQYYGHLIEFNFYIKLYANDINIYDK